MDTTDDAGMANRLDQYFGRLGAHLKDVRKRESFAMYAFGILGDGERKSAEPIAARAAAEPVKLQTSRNHGKLLHFLARAAWDDHAVRLEATQYGLEALTKDEPVGPWILDDTGFLKQGKHSVGVQRQYTGSAGKITNCQIGVSLAVATRSQHLPIDFELYLPKSWTEDPELRRETRIPADVVFKTKPELGLGMIRRAVDDGIQGDIVLADSAFGDSSDFRNSLRDLGFDFGVGLHSTTKVVRLGSNGRPRGEHRSVERVAMAHGRKRFRNLTWRESTNNGAKRRLASRFAFIRVKTTHDDGLDLGDREPMWLVVEWPSTEPKPTKYILTTLPRRMSKKQIVRTFKERWRTERMYEDLKGELGLDHFEGRSFPGWHHHVSVVLACYAFVVAERSRAFPPSAGRSRSCRPLALAA